MYLYSFFCSSNFLLLSSVNLFDPTFEMDAYKMPIRENKPHSNILDL